MGFIYKITNCENNKVYIGQTVGSIEHRFKEHKNAAKRGCDYKFHRAIRKYGVENFIIEQVEECNNNLLDDREIYWIKYYDSYHKGYNSTKGGNGLQKPLPDFEVLYQEYVVEDKTIREIAKNHDICEESVRKVLKRNGIKVKKKPSYDYKKIADSYKEFKNERRVCEKYGCSSEVVKRACEKYEIKVLSAGDVASTSRSKIVYQISLKTGKIINSFESAKKAGEAVGNEARGLNISDVCRGRQKTAFGYYWSYSKDYTLPNLENQKKKKICQLDKQGNLIKIFDSVASASEEISGVRENTCSTCIASCARGKFSTAYGYKWKYLEEGDVNDNLD